MNLNPKIAAMIGFAEKSGKLLQGTHAVEDVIRRRRAQLVLAAADLNPKRLKILKQWCESSGIPMLTCGEKEEYGRLLRKRPLGLLAITDLEMARGVINSVSGPPKK